MLITTTTNHQPVPMPTMMQCHQCIFFIKMHPNHQPVSMPTMMQESTGSCNVSGWGTLHSGLTFCIFVIFFIVTFLNCNIFAYVSMMYFEVDRPQTSWWWFQFLLLPRLAASLSEIKINLHLYIFLHLFYIYFTNLFKINAASLSEIKIWKSKSILALLFILQFLSKPSHMVMILFKSNSCR